MVVDGNVGVTEDDYKVARCRWKNFGNWPFDPATPVKMHRMSLKRGPFEKGPSFFEG